jgi:hypothetical protein
VGWLEDTLGSNDAPAPQPSQGSGDWLSTTLASDTSQPTQQPTQSWDWLSSTLNNQPYTPPQPEKPWYETLWSGVYNSVADYTPIGWGAKAVASLGDLTANKDWTQEWTDTPFGVPGQLLSGNGVTLANPLEQVAQGAMGAMGAVSAPFGQAVEDAANSNVPGLSQLAQGTRWVWENNVDPVLNLAPSVIGAASQGNALNILRAGNPIGAAIGAGVDLAQGRNPLDYYNNLWNDTGGRLVQKVQDTASGKSNDILNYEAGEAYTNTLAATGDANLAEQERQRVLRKNSNIANYMEAPVTQHSSELPSWIQLATSLADPIGNKAGDAIFSPPIKLGTKALGKAAEGVGITKGLDYIGTKLETSKQVLNRYKKEEPLLKQVLDADAERQGLVMPLEAYEKFASDPTYRASLGYDTPNGEVIATELKQIFATEHQIAPINPAIAAATKQAMEVQSTTPLKPNAITDPFTQELTASKDAFFKNEVEWGNLYGLDQQSAHIAAKELTDSTYADITTPAQLQLLKENTHASNPDNLSPTAAADNAKANQALADAGFKSRYDYTGVAQPEYLAKLGIPKELIQADSSTLMSILGKSLEFKTGVAKLKEGEVYYPSQLEKWGVVGKGLDAFAPVTGFMANQWLERTGRVTRDALSNEAKMWVSGVQIFGGKSQIDSAHKAGMSVISTRHGTQAAELTVPKQGKALKALSVATNPEGALLNPAIRAITKGKVQGLNDISNKIENFDYDVVRAAKFTPALERNVRSLLSGTPNALVFEPYYKALIEGKIGIDEYTAYVIGELPQFDMQAAISDSYAFPNFDASARYGKTLQTIPELYRDLAGTAFAVITDSINKDLQKAVESYNKYRAEQGAIQSKGKKGKSRPVPAPAIRLSDITPDSEFWKGSADGKWKGVGSNLKNDVESIYTALVVTEATELANFKDADVKLRDVLKVVNRKNGVQVLSNYLENYQALAQKRGEYDKYNKPVVVIPDASFDTRSPALVAEDKAKAEKQAFATSLENAEKKAFQEALTKAQEWEKPLPENQYDALYTGFVALGTKKFQAALGKYAVDEAADLDTDVPYKDAVTRYAEKHAPALNSSLKGQRFFAEVVAALRAMETDINNIWKYNTSNLDRPYKFVKWDGKITPEYTVEAYRAAHPETVEVAVNTTLPPPPAPAPTIATAKTGKIPVSQRSVETLKADLANAENRFKAEALVKALQEKGVQAENPFNKPSTYVKESSPITDEYGEAVAKRPFNTETIKGTRISKADEDAMLSQLDEARDRPELSPDEEVYDFMPKTRKILTDPLEINNAYERIWDKYGYSNAYMPKEIRMGARTTGFVVSQNSLQNMARTYAANDKAIRKDRLQSFIASDHYIRDLTGNAYHLDPQTFRLQRISDGAYLQDLIKPAQPSGVKKATIQVVDTSKPPVRLPSQGRAGTRSYTPGSTLYTNTWEVRHTGQGVAPVKVYAQGTAKASPSALVWTAKTTDGKVLATQATKAEAIKTGRAYINNQLPAQPKAAPAPKVKAAKPTPPPPEIPVGTEQLFEDLKQVLSGSRYTSFLDMPSDLRKQTISKVAIESGFPDPYEAHDVQQGAAELKAKAISYIDAVEADARHRYKVQVREPKAVAQQNREARAKVKEDAQKLIDQAYYARQRAAVLADREATAAADKMFFDYNDKNQLDIAMGNIIPFNYWARKNFVWMAQHFAEHPMHLAAILNFYNNLEEENRKKGLPEYMRGNILLWENEDGTRVTWNFGGMNPFGVANTENTFQILDMTDANYNKTANKQPLAVLVGADRKNTKGEYTGRDIGLIGAFFRPNPVIDAVTKTGIWSDILNQLGTKDNIGNPGPSEKQALGLTPGRSIWQAVGAATGATPALRKAGLPITDIDTEGWANELLFGKNAGKPLSALNQELTMMAQKGEITQAQAIEAIAGYKAGNWTPTALAALDRVDSSDVGRRLLSLSGFSLATANTPRQQVADTIYKAEAGLPFGSTDKADKQKVADWFNANPGAEVLSAGSKTPADLQQLLKDDKTRPAMNDLYAKLKDKTLSSKDFATATAKLQGENPAYFEKYPVDAAQQDYFTQLEEYQTLSGDYAKLSEIAANYKTAGNKAASNAIYNSKEYTQARAARDQYLATHPDFAKQYKEYKDTTYGTTTTGTTGTSSNSTDVNTTTWKGSNNVGGSAGGSSLPNYGSGSTTQGATKASFTTTPNKPFAGTTGSKSGATSVLPKATGTTAQRAVIGSDNAVFAANELEYIDPAWVSKNLSYLQGIGLGAQAEQLMLTPRKGNDGKMYGGYSQATYNELKSFKLMKGFSPSQVNWNSPEVAAAAAALGIKRPSGISSTPIVKNNTLRYYGNNRLQNLANTDTSMFSSRKYYGGSNGKKTA